MVARAVLMVLAKVPEPATTAVNTASRTKAYSSMSWPDSSRCNLLINCLNFMLKLLFELWHFCHSLAQTGRRLQWDLHTHYAPRCKRRPRGKDVFTKSRSESCR